MDMSKTKTFRNACAQLVYTAWTGYLDERLQSDEWDSSAQNLENALRERGVNIPRKLYYEYKFPGDMKNFEIDRATLFIRVFPAVYENFLERFNTVGTKISLLRDQKTNPKNDLTVFFGFCISLALSDMKNLKNVFEQSYEKCMQEVYQMAEKIRELNPELQNIEDWKNLNFVNGAIYGFAPSEIEFFLQLQRRRQTRFGDYETYGPEDKLNRTLANRQKISEFVHDHVGYFLAPETSDEILKAIENYKQRQIQQQNLRNGLSIS